MNHQDFEPVIWKKKNKENNKKHNPEGTAQFHKLDGDEPPPPPTIDYSMKVKIQQARTNLKMTQKELAMKINVPVVTISSYESGKVKPSRHVIRKIQQILKIKL